MRFLVIAATTGVLVSTTATSDAVTSGERVVVPEYTCELLDKGLYQQAGERIRFEDPGSVTGERFEVDEVEFTQQTSTVVMRVGRGFGIRYRIKNLPTDRSFHLTWRISYPRPGVHGRPGWERGFEEVTPSGDITGFLLYDFVYAWEMVRGGWRFEVLIDHVPTCSFTFQAR